MRNQTPVPAAVRIASVAVSATASVSAMVDAAETPPASVDEGRYRETEHVRDYYRTAKV